MPCCDLCYVKYINKDGTIDQKKLTELQNPRERNEKTDIR